MSEKTKWFYTEFKHDTKAVVMLAHGLNLLPSKMDELALFLNSKKCDVLRISLGKNPNIWTEKFSDDYAAALEHALILDRPLYFVGYSLGALIGVHFMKRHSHHQFSRIVLMAPATNTHFFTLIPAIMGHVFPKLSLPSFNLTNYRDRKSTTLLEYKKMHQLQKEIDLDITKNLVNLPVLLVINPLDEVISSAKLSKFAQLNPNWKTLTLSNSGSLLPKKFHHLMIDQESVGPKEWQKLLKNLTDHMSL